MPIKGRTETPLPSSAQDTLLDYVVISFAVKFASMLETCSPMIKRSTAEAASKASFVVILMAKMAHTETHVSCCPFFPSIIMSRRTLLLLPCCRYSPHHRDSRNLRHTQRRCLNPCSDCQVAYRTGQCRC